MPSNLASRRPCRDRWRTPGRRWPQEAAIGRVADQCLVALLELALQAHQHGGAVGGILVGLGLVAVRFRCNPARYSDLKSDGIPE